MGGPTETLMVGLGGFLLRHSLVTHHEGWQGKEEGVQKGVQGGGGMENKEEKKGSLFLHIWMQELRLEWKECLCRLACCAGHCVVDADPVASQEVQVVGQLACDVRLGRHLLQTLQKEGCSETLTPPRQHAPAPGLHQGDLSNLRWFLKRTVPAPFSSTHNYQYKENP